MTTAVRQICRRMVGLVRGAWLMVGITLLFILLAEGGLRLSSLVYHRLAGHHSAPVVRSDAYSDSAWVNDYYRELSRLSLLWRPYVYWRMKPFTGKYINVDADGHRFDPAAELGQTDSGTVLRIFVFGGSTMWGFGVRDAFTIPALLTRELRGKGVVCEVTNFGEMGYVSTQEVLALLLQLREGNIPDVVVFYDGINDCGTALDNRVAGMPMNEYNRVEEFNLSSWGRFRDRLRIDLRQLGERSHLMNALERLPRALGILQRRVSWEPHSMTRESIRDELLAHEVVDRYRDNLELATFLAERYGFRCLFYWQPTIVQKTNLSDYEKKVGGPSHLQRFWMMAYTAARVKLASDSSRYRFHDVSGAFSSTAEPIFVDVIHLGESGNGRIAEIMASDILTLLSQR